MKFLNKVRKIDLKKAGYTALTIGIINIFLHIAVLIQVLPYTWVNGGRTESYAAACQISFSSIVITILNLLITMIASGIIPIKFNRFWGIALSVFLIVTLPFDVVGIIQQFLGTIFEKCFTSILTIVAFLADFRIAFEKRWPDKTVHR